MGVRLNGECESCGRHAYADQPENKCCFCGKDFGLGHGRRKWVEPLMIVAFGVIWCFIIILRASK